MSTLGSKIINPPNSPLSKSDRERLQAARKSVDRLEADLSGLSQDADDLNYLINVLRHGVLLALDGAGENIRPLASAGARHTTN
ncbi:MAG: hypothetical protein P8J78_07425 [Maricaulis sp.]|jgi:hypothetical protein|nr:hypothetical protein [Maricaulis sp.]MDG2044423.1 hypothetical protein [Maricaulis sp.]